MMDPQQFTDMIGALDNTLREAQNTMTVQDISLAMMSLTIEDHYDQLLKITDENITGAIAKMLDGYDREFPDDTPAERFSALCTGLMMQLRDGNGRELMMMLTRLLIQAADQIK